MALAVLAMGIVIALVGAVGIVTPALLLTIAELFMTPAGLYAAAGFRVALGTALVLAAPTSRAPATIRVLGIVIIAGGLVTPLLGVDRARMIVAWCAGQGSTFLRIWAGVALAFGLLLAYALAPRRSPADPGEVSGR